MKKVFMVFLAAVLWAAWGAGQALAQDKKVEFSLNAGTLTLYGGSETFEAFGLTCGLQVDIHATKGFMISPEFMFLTGYGLAGFAGATFNFVGRGFFIGGGAVLHLSISGGLGVGELLPKVHLGYHGRKINLGLYITPIEGIFQYGLVGANIGFKF